MNRLKKLQPLIYGGKHRRSTGSTNEPLVVLTFDDSYASDYTIAFPMFQAKGIKGTTFAVSDWVGGNDFCTWDQLRDMQQADHWDVQCHTKTHPDLSTLTEEEIRDQFEAVDQAFTSNSLPAPRFTAYPYGGTNDLVNRIGYEYRDMQRLTGRFKSGINTRKGMKESPYHVINATSVDMQTQEEYDKVIDSIQWGYDTGKVIVLYCHQITREPDDYDYNILEQRLDELTDYIVNLGVRTLTISELYDEIY